MPQSGGTLTALIPTRERQRDFGHITGKSEICASRFSISCLPTIHPETTRQGTTLAHRPFIRRYPKSFDNAESAKGASSGEDVLTGGNSCGQRGPRMRGAER